MLIAKIFEKKNILLAKALDESLADVNYKEKFFAINSVLGKLIFGKELSTLPDSFVFIIEKSLEKFGNKNLLCLLLAWQNMVAKHLNIDIAYVIYNENTTPTDDAIKGMIKKKLSIDASDIFVQHIMQKRYAEAGFSIFYKDLVLHNNLAEIKLNIKKVLFNKIESLV